MQSAANLAQEPIASSKETSRLNVWISHAGPDQTFVREQLVPALERHNCTAIGFNLLYSVGPRILDFGTSNDLFFVDAACAFISKAFIQDVWLCAELFAFLQRERALRRRFVIPLHKDEVQSPGLDVLLGGRHGILCTEPDSAKWTLELGEQLQTLRRRRLALFISHSAYDVYFVGPLARLLAEVLGLQPHEIRCASVPDFGFQAGEIPDDLLRREVYEADVVLGVLTEKSIASTYVMFELGARWGTGRRLVPVYASGLSHTKVQRPLNLFTPFSLEYPEQLQRLIDTIGELLGRKPKLIKREQLDEVARLCRPGVTASSASSDGAA